MAKKREKKGLAFDLSKLNKRPTIADNGDFELSYPEIPYVAPSIDLERVQFAFSVDDDAGGRLKIQYNGDVPFGRLADSIPGYANYGPAHIPIEERPKYLLNKTLEYVEHWLPRALADATAELMQDAYSVIGIESGGIPLDAKDSFQNSSYVKNRRKRYFAIPPPGRPPGPNKQTKTDFELILDAIPILNARGEKITKTKVGRFVTKDQYPRPDGWVTRVVSSAGYEWNEVVEGTCQEPKVSEQSSDN